MAFSLLPNPQPHAGRANLHHWGGESEFGMHPPGLFGSTLHEERVDDFPYLLPGLSDL